jgi:hypothetical protein
MDLRYYFTDVATQNKYYDLQEDGQSNDEGRL